MNAKATETADATEGAGDVEKATTDTATTEARQNQEGVYIR